MDKIKKFHTYKIHYKYRKNSKINEISQLKCRYCDFFIPSYKLGLVSLKRVPYEKMTAIMREHIRNNHLGRIQKIDIKEIFKEK